MENVTLKERASKIIEGWKKDVDQLKVQVEHSTDEAKDAFENQKIALEKWTDKVKNDLIKAEGLGEEKAKTLLGSLEDLRVQAALGKMESQDILHDQQKKINKSIHDLKYAVSKMEKEVVGNAKVSLEKANQALEGYQTKFEMFRLQLDDSREGAALSWHEAKKNISTQLHKMGDQLENRKDEASDKWDVFSNEMKASWKHLRKAINQN